MTRFTLCLLLLFCITASAQEEKGLRHRLGADWTQLSVAAIRKDACMGHLYFGFVLRHAKGKVMLHGIEGAGVQHNEKYGREVSEVALRHILDKIDAHWLQAEISQSPLEKLPAKLETITDTADRLIAKLKAMAAPTVSIEVSLGPVGRGKSEEFDIGDERGFMSFIENPMADAPR